MEVFFIVWLIVSVAIRFLVFMSMADTPNFNFSDQIETKRNRLYFIGSILPVIGDIVLASWALESLLRWAFEGK